MLPVGEIEERLIQRDRGACDGVMSSQDSEECSNDLVLAAADMACGYHGVLYICWSGRKARGERRFFEDCG